ncbi:MAG: hypothetical protein ABI333_14580 [bacterium]
MRTRLTFSRHRWLVSAAALSWVALIGSPAGAATFDEQTGRLTLDAAAYGVSFDSGTSIPGELEAVFHDQDDEQVSGGAATLLFEQDAQGLEGDGALRMGGDQRGRRLPSSLPPSQSSAAA